MKEIILTDPIDILAYRRGSIIQSAIGIEYYMDVIVGRFFSEGVNDRVSDVIRMFDLSKIMSHSKQLFIDYIVNHHFPQVKERHKTLFVDMDFLISTRNKLAHKRISSDDYTDAVKLTWNRKSNRGNIMEYEYDIDEKEVKNINDCFSRVFVGLMFLESEICKKYNREVNKMG
jgi:hypothetical protein